MDEANRDAQDARPHTRHSDPIGSIDTGISYGGIEITLFSKEFDRRERDMNDAIGDPLRDIIARHGRSYLDDPRRCAEMVRENPGPARKREAEVLNLALRHGVPQRLLAMSPAHLTKTTVVTSAAQIERDVVRCRLTRYHERKRCQHPSGVRPTAWEPASDAGGEGDG